MDQTRYSRLRYDGRDLYVEEPFQSRDLHPRVVIMDDGLRSEELPLVCSPISADRLPRGAWRDVGDPDCAADRQYDQDKDDRLTGDR